MDLSNMIKQKYNEVMYIMNELKRKDFFFCYNMKFSKELEQQGFRYICSAKNHNSNSIFHLYYLSNELKQYLDTKHAI